MSRIITYLKSICSTDQSTTLDIIHNKYLYDVHYANGVVLNKINFIKLDNLVQTDPKNIIRIDRWFLNDTIIMIYAKYMNPWILHQNSDILQNRYKLTSGEETIISHLKSQC